MRRKTTVLDRINLEAIRMLGIDGYLGLLGTFPPLKKYLNKLNKELREKRIKNGQTNSSSKEAHRAK